MIKTTLFNVCLFLVLGLGSCKLGVAQISDVYLLDENRKVSPMAIGFKHFRVTEYELPNMEDLFQNQSTYSVDLNLQETGMIYRKSTKNKSKANKAGGNSKGNVITIEKGDYVRFIEKDDAMQLGTTLALDSGLNFKQLLNELNSDPDSVPIDLDISLVEYTHENIDVISLYQMFTSNQTILSQYVSHKNIQSGQPILAFSEEPVSFREFLEDDSGIFEMLMALTMSFLVKFVLQPLYLQQMDQADWKNEQLEDLFDNLITELALEESFFQDYELVFTNSSFLGYINQFLIEKQTSNLLIETVMMSVATKNESLSVHLITEDIEDNEEAQLQVQNSLKNIFYTLVNNMYMSLKKDLQIKPSARVVSKIKPILDAFNSKVQAEPSLAKYKDAFAKIQPLSLVVFATNFTPEIIEVFFWAYQMEFADFLSHYLLFSSQLPSFTDFFADDNLKISNDKVVEVWKYIHPDFFSDVRTRKFKVIKETGRLLI